MIQDRQLSRYFRWAELRCPCAACGGACNMQAPFLVQLDKLREMHGGPLTIASGYRCAAHNAQVGGKAGSAHMAGSAADILTPTAVVLRDVVKAALAVGMTGVGINNGTVHVDFTPAGIPRMWTYYDLYEKKRHVPQPAAVPPKPPGKPPV